jgi:hypothetical protein
VFRVISKAELLWNGVGGSLLQIIDGDSAPANDELGSERGDDLSHDIHWRSTSAIFIVAELLAGDAQGLGESFLGDSRGLSGFSDLLTKLTLPVHDVERSPKHVDTRQEGL